MASKHETLLIKKNLIMLSSLVTVPKVPVKQNANRCSFVFHQWRTAAAASASNK